MANMNKAFSLYLDVVRFAAACLVYMYHSNQRLLVNDILPASNFGHASVIVFFVLSGFVIAYITDTREKEFASYAASRISRIYSVAFPAVVLTVLFDAIGRQLYPAMYGYPFDNFLLRIMGSVFMLNEVWFISITSFSNVPYWSICYEMWYYVAFGIVMFLPKRTAQAALLLLALILGPKIVMLAPIWALGVVLYRWRRLQNLSQAAGWLLVVASCAGIVLFEGYGLTEYGANFFKSLIGEKWHVQFTFSKFFISDYLLALLVFLNFAGVRTVSASIGPLLIPLERPIRFMAGYTLSLYLLHQPLFLFWAAVIRGDPQGHLFWWMTTAMVALSVVAIGYFTETRRHLLKTRIERWLLPVQARLQQKYAAA